MLPKYHILWGIIFSILIWFSFPITFFNLSLIFLSSVLIDFDHYMWYVLREKDLSLKNAYTFLKKVSKTRHKPIMHLFHTIEFLIFIAVLAYSFNFFLFILTGMLFHSIVDVIDLTINSKSKCREFSLFKYLISDKNKYF